MNGQRPILLTGAAGQVGYEICRLAAERGINLVGLNHQQLDVADSRAVNGKITDIQPSLVINCAAYTAVDKAEDEKDLAFRVNRDGVANLAKSCGDLGISLLHISTDYVFDGEKDSSYMEDVEACPLGVYGLSKWQGEEAVRQNLAEYLIIRTSWVFGPHGNNFVKTMLRLAREGGELRVVADQFGCPTFATHLAETLLFLAGKVLTDSKVNWGTYHYCGAPVTSRHLFAKAILVQALRVGLIEKAVPVIPISTKEYPTPASRPPKSVLDCTRIKSILGIEPPNWQQGLNDMLEKIAGEI